MGEPAQKRLVRRIDLERFLSQVKPHPSPKVHLEQYTTSESAAATMLYLAAYTYGDIEGKNVLDLGCGTGRLGLGAAFLGAESVVGIDIDRTAVKAAFEGAVRSGLKAKTDWIAGDIDAVTGKFDTVLQNPPFGVQKLKADRRFLEKALTVGHMIYSFHNHPYADKQLLSKIRAKEGFLQIMPSPFILRFVEEHGGKVDAVFVLSMAMPRMFSFHSKQRLEIVIDLYVIRKKNSS